MFLKKLPCCAVRIIDIHHCPCDGDSHDVSDYPFYYDSCYFPDMFPENFGLAVSVCIWLKISIFEHAEWCSICGSNLFHSINDIDVQFAGIIFNIFVSHEHVCSLTVFEIEHASFSFCSLI